jgi:FKBP-type peptidyl-prolyl cis-trans isomerase 2
MYITESTIVTMRYIVEDVSGSVLDNTYANTPIKFQTGRGDFPIGFEKQLMGLKTGQHKAIYVPAEEGYGERKKELILKVNRHELPSDIEIKVGSRIRRYETIFESELFTVQGYIGDWIYLDRNHPYAGIDLNYKVHIVDVNNDW